MFFQDINQVYRISITKEVYEQMIKYCIKAYPYETGGVLIGNYSLDQTTANILQATSPPKASKHSRNCFYRSSTGLKKVLDSAWDKGQYYLGEWHYHPKSSSEPSSTDIRQMHDISQNVQLKCPEPILIIIGGYYLNWNISVNVFNNHKYTTLK